MNLLEKCKKIITVAILSLFASPIFAALPPLPQSIHEIEAILQSDFLKSDEMTPETIWQIQKTETGYILETSHFVIPVEVIPHTASNLGPGTIEAKFDLDKLIAKD